MKKALFLLTAGIPISAFMGLYRYTFEREKPLLFRLLLDGKSHSEDYYERRDSARDRLRGSVHIRYSIKSDRGEKLQGYYFPCGKTKSRKIAFIVHGYRSDYADNAGVFSELFRELGFDLFCCDNTASGESGGRLFGFDLYESEDCLKWLDFLRSELGEDIEILLHGCSMGGATVLKMSDRVPDCVKTIVADSAFIDAREVLRPQLGPVFPLMSWLFSLDSGRRLSDSNVIENVKGSKAPILIVHGKDDPTVPFSMAPRIFEHCPAGSDFLYTEEARHIESSHYARQEYKAKLEQFTEKYFSKE